MGESRSQTNITIAPDSVRPVGEPEVSSRPDHWQRLELGDLVTQTRERAKDRAFEVMSCSKVHGVILQSEKFKRRVASMNVSNYRVLDSGAFVYDPMLLWDGSIGRNNYGFPGVVSPAYNVFEANHRVDAAYLEYLLRSPAMIPQYVRISEGTNVRRRKAKFDDFAKISILLPPLAEQRFIANVLRSVEKAMQTTEQVIEASRELKRSLMNHLFTYGPVPVDEAEQVPLKETEVGSAPVHWKILRLGDSANIVSGGTPSRRRPELWNGEIPWVKTGEVKYNVITSPEERISEQGLEESSARMIPAGTLLVAMYGQGVTRGRVAMLGIDAAINQACAAISPMRDLNPRFLYHFFSFNYEAIRNLGHGAHQKNLSAALLKALSVPRPSPIEQENIVRSLDVMEQKIVVEEKRRRSLGTLFKSLLHNLMTGSLRVSDEVLSEVAGVV